jgi:hypothetical protein
MTGFRSKSIQQFKGFILLGALTFLAIPVVLVLSGVAFVVIVIGLGCLAVLVAWTKVMRISIQRCTQWGGGNDGWQTK